MEQIQDVRRSVRLLLADRRSPEAAALFDMLMRYSHKRVGSVTRRCGNALAASEQEEVVADVLLTLLRGALASFRGESVGELFAFVRTIADRSTWRKIRRKEKEARALAGDAEQSVRDWMATPEAPDARVEVEVESPLPQADQAYLRALLISGSKAEHARRSGVSRAAVTQRIKRIHARLDAMEPSSRGRHEAWLGQQASEVVLLQS